MRRILLLLAAAPILLAPVTYAQDNESSGAAQADKSSAVRNIESNAVDPTLTSGGGGTAPAVSFQFSNDEKTATAQIGGGTSSDMRWGLTVSGPVSKASDQTTLVTAEGLNSGFNAQFTLRKIFTQATSHPTSSEFRAICHDFLRPELGGQVPNPCTRGNLTAEGQRILDDMAFKPTWTIGGSVKAGRSTFDYADPSTFVDQSVSHDGSSFAVSGGRFQAGSLSSLLYYVGGSFRHESAFIAGGAQNICTPIGQSGSTRCRDIAIGPPIRRSTNLLQLEARSFIGTNIGLAPRVTYEANGHEWSIELPIYLRNIGSGDNGSGSLNGGLNLGWDSKNHGIVLSLFVGALPKITQ